MVFSFPQQKHSTKIKRFNTATFPNMRSETIEKWHAYLLAPPRFPMVVLPVETIVKSRMNIRSMFQNQVGKKVTISSTESR